jgi:hypothetical protein
MVGDPWDPSNKTVTPDLDQSALNCTEKWGYKSIKKFNRLLENI